jgi:serine/threonine protein phosphatase PrpC
LGTDGLFDNVYDSDLLEIVKNLLKKNKATDLLKGSQVAQQIANFAHEKAKDKTYMSPFAKG